MEIRLYFQMLRRGWWIIALTTLTALVAALAASYFVTPQYSAIARFIVTPNAVLPDRPDVVLQGLSILDNQTVMTTYSEVMNSNRIYNDTLASLQLQPADLKDYTYKAVVATSSSVLVLTVTGPDRQLAAKLANTIGDEAIKFTRGLNPLYSVDFLDTAVPPDLPSSPQPLLNASLAITLGLVVGAVLAIMNEQLRVSWETFRQRLQLDNDTGVYNSKYFSRRVEEQLTKSPDEILTIGIIELTGLEDLLDTFPIVALQKALQKVTESLRMELRGNDIIGRWSEISFIVMLPNTNGVAARRIFERIFQALSQPLELEQLREVLNFDSHIGGAEYGAHISSHELFEMANRALQQARRDKETHVNVLEAKNPLFVGKKAST